MDLIKDCLCLSPSIGPDQTYEEVKLQSPMSLSPIATEASIEAADSKTNLCSSSPDMEVSLYSRLLMYEAYEEMEKNPFSTLYNVFVVRLDNHCEPLLHRAVLTTNLHDTFSLVRRYLESWRLLCIIIVRPNKDSITGLSLLAIGITAPINWLHTMLGNGAIMQEYFRYSRLHFTANTWSAVATPCDCPSITPAPANTPTPIPRTQTRILPTTSQSCPLMEPTLYTTDSDDDSIHEGDLVLYHHAAVHNYWIRTHWGTPASAGASQCPLPLCSSCPMTVKHEHCCKACLQTIG